MIFRHRLLTGALIVLTAAGTGFWFDHLHSSETTYINPSLSLPQLSTSTTVSSADRELPPQPTVDGKPVMLVPGKEQDAYMQSIADKMRPTMESPMVAVFGHTVSATTSSIVVREDPTPTLKTSGYVRNPRTYPSIGSAGADITAKLTPSTLFKTKSRSPVSLKSGDPVMVAGQRSGSGLVAQLVTDPQAFGAATSTKVVANNSSFAPVAAVARPSVVAASSATISGSAPNAAAGTSGGDTVTANWVIGGLFGSRGFTIDRDFSFGDPNGCPYLDAHVTLWFADGAEAHWPFQFHGLGPDQFTVDPKNRTDVEQSDLVVDASNYSFFAGLGGGAGVTVTAGCTAFGVGGTWPVFDQTWTVGFISRTFQRAPMGGDSPILVFGDRCPKWQFGAWIFSVALSACGQIEVDPGLFRATLSVPGGTPQGIAMAWASHDSVQTATLHGAGGDQPVHVDRFNYTPALVFSAQLGLSIGLDADNLMAALSAVSKVLSRKLGDWYPFYGEERHARQVGPILSDGRWQDTKGNWWDAKGNPASAGSAAEISDGLANWIHPGQKGATWSDGRWQDAQGTWREADGTITKDPNVSGGATPNNATKGGDPDSHVGPEELVESALSDLLNRSFHLDLPHFGITLQPTYDPTSLDLSLGVARAAVIGGTGLTAQQAADVVAMNSGQACMSMPSRQLVLGDTAAAFRYAGGRCPSGPQGSAGFAFVAYVYKDATGWHPHNWAGTQNYALPGEPLPGGPGYELINLSSGCVNVRQSPSTSAQSVACWPGGTKFVTMGTPVYADGSIWWQVETGDWSPPLGSKATNLHYVGWAVHDYLLGRLGQAPSD